MLAGYLSTWLVGRNLSSQFCIISQPNMTVRRGFLVLSRPVSRDIDPPVVLRYAEYRHASKPVAAAVTLSVTLSFSLGPSESLVNSSMLVGHF